MDEALKLINDNLIVIVAAFLGSAMKDILDFVGGRHKGHRILKFFVNLVFTVIVVLFVYKTIFPDTSWQLLSGLAIGFSFIAYRVAEHFSTTLSLLKIVPGGDKIKDEMEKDKKE